MFKSFGGFMRRTKLIDRVLPSYTKGEEIFNMTSHIVGGTLGIVATILCTIFAAIHNNVYGIVSGAIYGASLIIFWKQPKPAGRRSRSPPPTGRAMSPSRKGICPSSAKRAF